MAIRSNRRVTIFSGGAICALVGLLLVGVAGCPGDQQAAGRRAGTGLQRRTDQGEVLLGTAISQLGQLPSYVQTDLAPPQVLLDARGSRDGEDVQAVLGRHPNLSDDLQIYNYLQVTTGNARFRGLGVETGDIVKYFIDVDTSALATESGHFGNKGGPGGDAADPGDEPAVEWSEGIVREKALDFPVAQVVDDNTLIVARPLAIPWEAPAKIEVWRYSDERMLEINRRLGRYANRRMPALAWEPAPDEHALVQILDRLNPWSRQTADDSVAEADPLFATLPEELVGAEQLQPYLVPEYFGRSSFSLDEVRQLQQAVWLRDISEWVRSGSFDAVERAATLLDWTTRHIQLDGADRLDGADDELPRTPWQTLLYGHGTARQRAWVFCLLCRQQRMDVVMLTIPAEEEGSADTFWLPALVDDGQLYLFDTELGLPIPGPDGKGVATLAQLQADGTLLDALAIDDTLYRVTAAEAKRAVANVVASPFELSGRARRLEKELTGDARLAISVDAQALAEAVGGAEGVTDVRLWPLPFQTTLEQLTIGQSSRVNEAVAFQPFAWRPLLYKARVLHFQGKKETRKDPNRTGWVETTDSHQEAGKLYMDPRVRPPNRLLDALGSEDKRDVYTTAKSHASYWLGLLSFDDGRYDSAADWLGRLLEAEPDGPWASGARYNLARTYEELGRTDEAVALLEADDSPGRHGNLLRARRLRTVAAPSP